MKKRKILALLLALTVCAGPLAIPVQAYSPGSWYVRTVVAAGYGHMGMVTQNGDLYLWGNNDYGQLGDGTCTYRDRPVKIMSGVRSLALSYELSAAVKEDNTLWMWGRDVGAMPQQVLDHVVAVSLGNDLCAAIRTDGSLWMQGCNDEGQLGVGDTDYHQGFVPVMKDVAAVTLGERTAAAIKQDSTLWTWGSNDYYLLGVGEANLQSAEFSTEPIQIMENVIAVTVGDYGAAALTNSDRISGLAKYSRRSGNPLYSGRLWYWGSNLQGTFRYKSRDQLLKSDVPFDSGASAHYAYFSRYNAAYIDSYEYVRVAGNTEYGLTTNKYAMREDSTKGDAPVVLRSTYGHGQITQVALGDVTAIASCEDGSVWVWGFNGPGRLGIGAGAGDGSIHALAIPDNCQYEPVELGLQCPQGKQLVVDYQPEHLIHLILNGGQGTSAIACEPGGKITPPTNPTKEGYTFAGWYTDQEETEPWNFNQAAPEELILYAKWVPVSSMATTTTQSSQIITLNSNAITLDAYTLEAPNGGDVTYVKLRDVAALVENTEATFNVDWRNNAIYVETGKTYTSKNGTELKRISGADGSYKWNTAPVLVDGVTTALEGIVITDGQGGGHTFFKLRDLGKALGFNVGWSADKGVFLETDKPYNAND